jgi:putative oxidoreductase
MRGLFYPDWRNRPTSVGLLLLRLAMGAAFIFHGWPKIQHPFGWMGPDASVPGVLQFLAALSEFGGGMALILGLLTRLAALGIGATMTVAITTVHLPHGDPFVAATGGRSY